MNTEIIGLTRMALWGRVAGRKGDGAGEYRRYIEATVRQGGEMPPESWLERVVWGSKRFIEKMGRHVKGDRLEQRGVRNWDKVVEFEEVVKLVERMKREKWSEFVDRYGDWGRDVVLWAARKWSGLTLKELGQKAGGLDYPTVSHAVRRVEWKAKHDRELNRKLRWIRVQLLNM